MSDAVPLIALVGNPNAGKSSLFNALTGARQKIGNYPGVTVERKAGRATLASGAPVELVDLPGTYSLTPTSLDEAVTRDVIVGNQGGERRPDALIIVVDASNLENHMRFTLELLAQDIPAVVALNMIDMAERDGLDIDPDALADALGVPVVATVAVRRRGLEALLAAVESEIGWRPAEPTLPAAAPADSGIAHDRAMRLQAARIARQATRGEAPSRQMTRRIDALLLHPVWGFVVMLGIMFVMFQAVFAWAEAPIGWIEAGMGWIAARAGDLIGNDLARSFVVDGVVGGVGAVVAFLPQILILFFFILMLEATGYMTRAAFLMDGIMAKVGLSGRGFIPLLSSFACAVPGIMATRSIADPKDRLTTILIAPLMTCSARLPVYALIIGAFIPARTVWPGIGLQGLVLFTLFIAGIVSALLVAWVLRRSVTRGGDTALLMEMPRYQLPSFKDVALALWQRALIFLKRAGTIIFMTTIILWALMSFPKPPAGSDIRPVSYSVAGRIASVIEPAVRPIGFNEDIALALIPTMAAREVAVSALATANAIDAGNDEAALDRTLGQRLAGKWTLATALAYLAWFVFAPQCISTIAITRRETNGWKWPAFMVSYLFALAYLAAGATYWAARAMGLG